MHLYTYVYVYVYVYIYIEREIDVNIEIYSSILVNILLWPATLRVVVGLWPEGVP